MRKKRRTVSQLGATSHVRRYPRADIPGRVYVHDSKRLYIASLINLSAGGLFIKDVTAIPNGTEVRVMVKSPQLNRSVQAIGDVIRIESEGKRLGLAVKFKDISRASQKLIQTSVQAIAIVTLKTSLFETRVRDLNFLGGLSCLATIYLESEPKGLEYWS